MGLTCNQNNPLLYCLVTAPALTLCHVVERPQISDWRDHARITLY